MTLSEPLDVQAGAATGPPLPPYNADWPQPIPGDITIRPIVITVVVVVAMKVTVTRWKNFTSQKTVKIARYTFMTAVAADADATVHEHCNDEDVGDEVGPCEAMP